MKFNKVDHHVKKSDTVRFFYMMKARKSDVVHVFGQFSFFMLKKTENTGVLIWHDLCIILGRKAFPIVFSQYQRKETLWVQNSL